jgi:hypothetical protein
MIIRNFNLIILIGLSLSKFFISFYYSIVHSNLHDIHQLYLMISQIYRFCKALITLLHHHQIHTHPLHLQIFIFQFFYDFIFFAIYFMLVF